MIATKFFPGRYDPALSEKLFESVWRTIADILAMLVSLHFSTGKSLEEIPQINVILHGPAGFVISFADRRRATRPVRSEENRTGLGFRLAVAVLAQKIRLHAYLQLCWQKNSAAKLCVL